MNDQTTRPEFTSPADGPRTAPVGAKVGEEPPSASAPQIRPAPGESPTGAEATPTVAAPDAGPETRRRVSGPVTPTARLLLPAGAPAAEWHAARQAGAGGSDVAAILGMDGHGGALRVWLEKTGQARPERNARLQRAARRGHALEPLVAELFAEESGLTVLASPGTLQHVDHPHWIANPDRLTVPHGGAPGDDLGVLECKTRNWRSAHTEGWRGDEAPDGPALQAHWYMTVTGYRHAHIAGLIDDDLTWFRLERDDELCAMLADAVDRFWHDHVEAGLPPAPDSSKAAAELLAHLWEAQDGAAVEVDPVEAMLLKQRRRELKDHIDALGDELTGVENQLKAMLGGSEVATVGGRPAFTWRANGQFAHARFREAEPELAAAYTHLVPAVDTTRLETEHPQTYRKYRARVLRTPTEG